MSWLTSGTLMCIYKIISTYSDHCTLMNSNLRITESAVLIPAWQIWESENFLDPLFQKSPCVLRVQLPNPWDEGPYVLDIDELTVWWAVQQIGMMNYLDLDSKACNIYIFCHCQSIFNDGYQLYYYLAAASSSILIVLLESPLQFRRDSPPSCTKTARNSVPFWVKGKNCKTFSKN